MASGYLERGSTTEDTHIYTNAVTEEILAKAELTRHCPTLFQKAVEKEYDVRVCVVDKHAVGVGLVGKEQDGSQRLDIRRDNMSDVEYVEANIPAEITESLLKLISSYNLRFAAIDMAVDVNGNWVFFEINPNGQWAWLDIAGGSDIAKAFVDSFSRP